MPTQDGVKISEMPLATTFSGNEFLPVVQDGENRRALIGVIQLLESFGDLPVPTTESDGP